MTNRDPADKNNGVMNETGTPPYLEGAPSGNGGEH